MPVLQAGAVANGFALAVFIVTMIVAVVRGRSGAPKPSAVGDRPRG